jgi:predicted DNA-binding transcriptional regulator AlpA
VGTMGLGTEMAQTNFPAQVTKRETAKRGIPKAGVIDDSVGENRLLNQREVSWLLGINEWTLEAWRSTKPGGPPFIKCGRLVRYSLKALRAYMKRQTVNPGRGRVRQRKAI